MYTTNIPTLRLTTRLLLQFPSTAKLCTPTLKISLDVHVKLSTLKKSNCQDVINSIFNDIATDHSSSIHVYTQASWVPKMTNFIHFIHNMDTIVTDLGEVGLRVCSLHP